MGSRKGDRWERKYRNALSASTPDEFADAHDFGIGDFDFVDPFTAVRMPSSGSAVPYDLPDLHVWLRSGDDVEQFAVEVKAGRDSVRFKSGGIPALNRFADATGAIPLAFVHIDYTGDFVIHADDLHETKKSHTFTKARDVDDSITTFAEWVESPFDAIP